MAEEKLGIEASIIFSLCFGKVVSERMWPCLRTGNLGEPYLCNAETIGSRFRAPKMCFAVRNLENNGFDL